MLKQRFENMIERVPESCCWIWIGALRNEYYGSFYFNGKTVLAHRFSVELYTGKRPKPNTVVDHICCVKCCVNPDHLEEVTQSDNIKRYYKRTQK